MKLTAIKLALLICGIGTLVILPDHSWAEMATSYEFANSGFVSTDARSSKIGGFLESFLSFFESLNGTTGLTLMLLCFTGTLLCWILGLPHAAISFAIVGTGILCINKPLLLLVVLVPLIWFRREFTAMVESASEDEEDEVEEITTAHGGQYRPKNKKSKKSKRDRRANLRSSVHNKPNSSQASTKPAAKRKLQSMSKLARPI